jgi:hypothetical protein
LHEKLQVLPDEMTDEHVPKAPFAGAGTEHELGVHVCAVKVPSVQNVAEPSRV